MDQREPGGSAMGDHYRRWQVGSFPSVEWEVEMAMKWYRRDVIELQMAHHYNVVGFGCIDAALIVWGSVMSVTTWSSCPNEAKYAIYLMTASFASSVLVAVVNRYAGSAFVTYIHDFL